MQQMRESGSAWNDLPQGQRSSCAEVLQFMYAWRGTCAAAAAVAVADEQHGFMVVGDKLARPA